MKVRKTYIAGLTRLSRRRDSGAGREGSFDLREGPGWPDHRTKNAWTAMLHPVPRIEKREIERDQES